MSVKKIQSPAQVPGDFHQMGEQLTAQYNRAVSGMVEVVKFGAMLHQVRSTLSNVDKVSSRGRPIDGNGIAGDGLKAWLEEFAPDIKRATAYRFLGVAEAVAEEYREIVGKRIADKYSLPELVLAIDLPKAAQLKQLELFDYVSGTSQRSWLDRFKKDEAKEPIERGGAREGAGRPKKDINAEASLAKSEWEVFHEELVRLMSKGAGNTFIHLDPDRLLRMDADLMDLRKKIKAVLSR